MCLKLNNVQEWEAFCKECNLDPNYPGNIPKEYPCIAFYVSSWCDGAGYLSFTYKDDFITVCM